MAPITWAAPLPRQLQTWIIIEILKTRFGANDHFGAKMAACKAKIELVDLWISMARQKRLPDYYIIQHWGFGRNGQTLQRNGLSLQRFGDSNTSAFFCIGTHASRPTFSVFIWSAKVENSSGQDSWALIMPAVDVGDVTFLIGIITAKYQAHVISTGWNYRFREACRNHHDPTKALYIFEIAGRQRNWVPNDF